MRNHGITVKSSKCQLLCNEVEYLGHVVTAAGVKTSEHKLEAILKAPRPNNVQQLRSLLGLINYYEKLNHLLGKKVQWQWDKECNAAFDEAKAALVSSKLLVHYDPNCPVLSL